MSIGTDDDPVYVLMEVHYDNPALQTGISISHTMSIDFPSILYLFIYSDVQYCYSTYCLSNWGLKVLHKDPTSSDGVWINAHSITNPVPW